MANMISVGVPLVGTIYWLFNTTKFPIGIIECSCFLIFYAIIGVGIGVGFHRCFTHQSFVPVRWLKLVLLFCGSLACQGSVIRWVADHRRHHRLADSEWDTHSPKFKFKSKYQSKVLGLFHAHFGWLFDRSTTNYNVYAPDLLKDQDFRFFHQTYFFLVGTSFILPFFFGFILGGLNRGVSCLLIGGCLRTTIFHNVVWGVNSIGHSYGSRDASSHDQSRNNALLAVATLGEGWHNNHHAYPRSAVNQLKWYQVDPNGWLILLLGKLGLATKIVRTTESSSHPI
jgi:stearoyl-CoA desaturase (delta-9 desaturase)